MKKILLKISLSGFLFFLLVWPSQAAFQASDIRINTNLDQGLSSSPRIANDNNGNVYSVWLNDRNDGSFGEYIYFNRSSDYGKNWMETDIPLIYPGSSYSNDLHIRCDDNGHIYVMWIAVINGDHRGVVFMRSDNYGKTWENQELAVRETSWTLGNIDSANDQTGHICVISNQSGSFPDGIYANCSGDYGHTWMQDYVAVHSNNPKRSDIQNQATISCDENGHFYAAWRDNRNRGRGGENSIYFNHSNDYGQSWHQDVEIVPTGFAFNAYSPYIDNDNNGNVYVAFRLFDGQAHTSYACFNHSSNYGADFNRFDYQRLASDSESPRVSLGESGNVYFSWLDAQTIYHKIRFVGSSDYGADWSESSQINNTHDCEGGNYYLMSSGENVYTLWENKEAWEGIYFNYSDDNGVTWQNQDIRVDKNYNDTTVTDTPVLSIDNSGNIYAAWQDGRMSSGDIFFNKDNIIVSSSVYQDFEPGNGSDSYGWGFNSASVGLSDEQTHSGTQAWKIVADELWGGTGIQSQTQTWDMNFNVNEHDRLTFWVYAIPQEGNDNSVSVKFFDHGNYNVNGFEVWTTQNALYSQWTQLKVFFSQLPGDLDLEHIDKIEFVNYWPGIYYIDDINLARGDRVYQSFEPYLRNSTDPGDYGWKWNSNDTVDLSSSGEPVHEGDHSWKFISTAYWGGTGIVSQEKRYLALTEGGHEQTFWHIDLDPDINDRLSFWVYSLAENGFDNTVAVQFFDFNDLQEEESTPVVVWSKKVAQYGQWTKFSIRFSAIEDAFNELGLVDNSAFEFDNINKIQLQTYWPGTYYFDDIRATGALPFIDKQFLSEGILQWGAIDGAEYYRVQESLNGADGPWETVYYGRGTSFQYDRLQPSWVRIRYEETYADKYLFLYKSDWSEPIKYIPEPVLIDTSSLKNGNLSWNDIGQSDIYKVQISQGPEGPWDLLYEGENTVLQAAEGSYYRVCAIRKEGDTIVENSQWSPVRSYSTEGGYLKTEGIYIREQGSQGKLVSLRGVNLGSYLLIEPWMTGIGSNDEPEITDDWHIRETLYQRFGEEPENELLSAFEDAFISEEDLNNLYQMGVNLIRLPVYYRNFMDEYGAWFEDPFKKIDRLIDLCAERGIYVLIDLHGAPGAQSEEFHTGREDFNKLFAPGSEGAIYRERTISLWRAIALHYADNPAVMGYDLINEPTGFNFYYADQAQGYHALWDFYDSLYDIIRSVDSDHIIVMEAVWDWDALPDPADYNWENIVYQFHYYLFEYDDEGEIVGGIEDFDAHKEFIDNKIIESRIKQEQYQIPVMIGEFNCFNHREIWEYYLEKFNQENWIWALWSYKTKDPSSQWGLYTHLNFDEEYPRISLDSYDDLLRKFSKYKTTPYYSENASLIGILSAYSNGQSLQALPPVLTIPSEQFIDDGETLSFTISAFDPNNDPIMLSAALTNGDDLSTIGSVFTDKGDGTGYFEWTANLSAGDRIEIAFIAEDATGLIVSKSLDLAINETVKMVSPVPGGMLSEQDVTFEWNTSSGVSEFSLGAGTSQGSISSYPWGDIYYGSQGMDQSATISGIPLDGGTVYVRLWYLIDDAWGYEDYVYQTVNIPAEPAQMLELEPGSTLKYSSVTFDWSAGTWVSSYRLGVGTTQSSLESFPWGDIVFEETGTATSAEVNNIPLNGNTIYVRLWSNIKGDWVFEDYTYQTKSFHKKIKIKPNPR